MKLTLFHVTTYRSCGKHLWLFLHFYQTHKKQPWQNSRPASTDLTLHMTIATPPIGHVINIYDFIL